MKALVDQKRNLKDRTEQKQTQTKIQVILEEAKRAEKKKEGIEIVLVIVKMKL